jgi:hypothetical protein
LVSGGFIPRHCFFNLAGFSQAQKLRFGGVRHQKRVDFLDGGSILEPNNTGLDKA